MKAMKSLLALSVLAALGNGAANAAAVATYDVHADNISILFGQLGGLDILLENSQALGTPPAVAAAAALVDGGSGTAVLDDTGVLTINTSNYTQTALGTAQTQQVVATINGSWNGTTFSATGGSFLYTACVEGQADPALFSCGSATAVLNTPFTLTGASGSVTLAGGSITTVGTTPNSVATINYALTNGVPAVPVPAAVWLFGSGLLGLAGTARRRRAA